MNKINMLSKHIEMKQDNQQEMGIKDPILRSWLEAN